MSGFLDTSVLVRYLTDDPPALALKSAAVIDGGEDLLVTDVVIAETAYVLTSVYGVSREAVVDSLIALLRKENIDTFGLNEDYVLEGLLLCRPSGRVSFADALVWAAARSAGSGTVYSFDGRFPNDGISVLLPGLEPPTPG